MFIAYNQRSFYMYYDSVAATKLLGLHTPSFVTIRYAVPVAGSTHAASRFSRVVKPVRPEGRCESACGRMRRR